MADETGWFWFSGGEYLDRLSKRQPRLYCELDSGEITEFTHKTETKDHRTRWSDIVPLGHGKYHHADSK